MVEWQVVYCRPPLLSVPAVTLVVWTMDPQQKGLSLPCPEGTRCTAGQVKTKVMSCLGLDPSHSSVFAVWMTSPELCEWPLTTGVCRTTYLGECCEWCVQGFPSVLQPSS